MVELQRIAEAVPAQQAHTLTQDECDLLAEYLEAKHVDLEEFKRRMWLKACAFSEYFDRDWPTCEGGERQWSRRKISRLGSYFVGHIVGITWLQQGRRIPGHHGGRFGEDYDPPTWKETGPRTPALLIVNAPNRKAYKVPLDGVKPLEWRRVSIDD